MPSPNPLGRPLLHNTGSSNRINSGNGNSSSNSNTPSPVIHGRSIPTSSRSTISSSSSHPAQHPHVTSIASAPIALPSPDDKYAKMLSQGKDGSEVGAVSMNITGSKGRTILTGSLIALLVLLLIVSLTSSTPNPNASHSSASPHSKEVTSMTTSKIQSPSDAGSSSTRTRLAATLRSFGAQLVDQLSSATSYLSPSAPSGSSLPSPSAYCIAPSSDDTISSSVCSGQGECFMYQCFCNKGIWGRYCEKSCDIETNQQCKERELLTSPNQVGIIEQTNLQFNIDQKRQKSEYTSSLLSTDYYEYQSNYTLWKFGWYAQVPLSLGNVLEIGTPCTPNTIIMLEQQPRSISSLTLIDPLLPSYMKRNECKYHHNYYPDLKVSFVNVDLDRFLREQHIDGLGSSGSGIYDTIIINDVISHSLNGLHSLENLYSLLKPEGTLLIAERTWDKEFAHVTPFAGDSNSYTIKFHSSVLQHFRRFFIPLYDTDAQVHNRLIGWRHLKGNKIDSNIEGIIGIWKKRKEEEIKEWVLNEEEQYVRSEEEQEERKKRAFNEDGYELPLTDYPLKVRPPIVEQFHLIWSTASIAAWRFHMIDSIFFHHPKSTINIYCNELLSQQHLFQPFLDAKYDLRILPINNTEFLSDTPLYKWINNEEMKSHHNFKVHMSDAFRLAILWKYGGVYIDFDVILLNNVKPTRNFLARELKDGMVNGALLNMDYRHPFINLALIMYPYIQNITEWPSSGPALQTNVMWLYTQLHPDKVHYKDLPTFPDDSLLPFDHLSVYQPSVFYPNAWMDARHKKFWEPEEFRQNEFDFAMKETYMFHIWTAMVGGIMNRREQNYVYPKSYMGKMILANCVVLCDKFKKDNADLDNGVMKLDYSHPLSGDDETWSKKE